MSLPGEVVIDCPFNIIRQIFMLYQTTDKYILCLILLLHGTAENKHKLVLICIGAGIGKRAGSTHFPLKNYQIFHKQKSVKLNNIPFISLYFSNQNQRR